MPHAYTEDQLVEQPAIGLFAELGWTTVSALERLNPVLPPEAITAAVDELTRDRSAMSRSPEQVGLASAEQIAQNVESNR